MNGDGTAVTLLGLLPDNLGSAAALALMAASAFTSFLTAAFGIGGGVTMLAVMAMLVPASAVVPVHAVVQIGSNFGRTVLMWRHIDWRILAVFAMGSAIGAFAGGLVVVELPGWLLQLGLAVFILWAIWGPKPGQLGSSKLALAAGGAISSFLTMFFGATGPFVASFVKALRLGRLLHMGTFSACMSVQHALKIAAFGVLGFAYGAWLPLLAAMIVTGFLGTLAGRFVLEQLDDRKFGFMLNLLLTLIAIRLLWSSLRSFIAG